MRRLIRALVFVVGCGAALHAQERFERNQTENYSMQVWGTAQGDPQDTFNGKVRFSFNKDRKLRIEFDPEKPRNPYYFWADIYINLRDQDAELRYFECNVFSNRLYIEDLNLTRRIGKEYLTLKSETENPVIEKFFLDYDIKNAPYGKAVVRFEMALRGKRAGQPALYRFKTGFTLPPTKRYP